ncbi:MAG: UDP-2,3-diacylglucosamine diphosphatase [Candidatus Kapabacteria bacterium]|jgi:UDP-2,3-diacylglucosamine hydrolase|nr:UDP-2,3-diacylglucosamine diphosphatase [Candidatus Kapabacteria bacterium]
MSMFHPVSSLDSLALAVPPGKRLYCISDVHLGYGNREVDRDRENLLVDFLRKASADAAAIAIVGDLFDLWFDYRHAIPRQHVRTLACLADLVRQGVTVIYLMGNHDFGHFTYFHEELGIHVYKGDVDLQLPSRRMYLAHGDGKAHHDSGYLVLRAILRNRWAQTAYRMLHPNWGIALASRTSHGSRDYTGQKDYGPADGLRDFAHQRIDEGYDLVIMGHRHTVMTEAYGSGLYVNLGHWLDLQPPFACWDPSDSRMRVGLVRTWLQTDDIRLVQ